LKYPFPIISLNYDQLTRLLSKQCPRFSQKGHENTIFRVYSCKYPILDIRKIKLILRIYIQSLQLLFSRICIPTLRAQTNVFWKPPFTTSKSTLTKPVENGGATRSVSVNHLSMYAAKPVKTATRAKEPRPARVVIALYINNDVKMISET